LAGNKRRSRKGLGRVEVIYDARHHQVGGTKPEAPDSGGGGKSLKKGTIKRNGEVPGYQCSRRTGLNWMRCGENPG